MNNSVNWIGKLDDTSGSYVATKHKNLQIRHGGKINARRLYKFTNHFGRYYYITELDVITEIEQLLNDYNETDMTDYLYGIIIEKLGITNLLSDIDSKMKEEFDRGYRAGAIDKQLEFKRCLGL